MWPKSLGRGLTVGEDSAENGLGCLNGGNVPSPDRLSDREDGDRMSVPMGEGTELLRRAPTVWDQFGPTSTGNGMTTDLLWMQTRYIPAGLA